MNPWTILLAASLAISGIAVGWSLRGDHEDAKRLRGIEKQIEQAEQIRATVDQAAAAQAKQAAEQSVRDRIITKEVIRYVQVTPPDRRCDLPGTFRVRHDAAATGQPAESASLADSQAEAVTDAAVLETVADNYATCRSAAEQVAGWIDFWSAVKESCRGG